MNDPVRLLDGGEVLSTDERRALEADAAEPSPPGVKHAVWGALAVKLTAVSAAAAATGATASSVAASTAAPVTLVSLVKAAGVGVALGTAVSTGLYFGTPREAARPAIAVASNPASGSSDTGAAPPPALDGHRPAPALDGAPQATGSSLPPGTHVAASGDQVSEAPPVGETESQRVARARALLRSGDAPRALQELRALEQDEPPGLLAQEREALLIEALVAVGQRETARERAVAFLKRYPASPHVRAVRRAVE